MKPLISVIIPFYNLANSVEYCLNSILNQQFDCYEVICVDDGSNDATYSELMKYASNPRVIVTRKKNGGLSDARNMGVTLANADYITFVDGDDIVSPWYLSSLWAGVSEGKDTMVFGNLIRIMAGERSEPACEWVKPTECIKVSKEKVLKLLCYEQMLPSACARLAPKHLYDCVPFPTGCKYEELSTIADYISFAQSIVLIMEPIYGYVMRRDSIVHSLYVSHRQIDDYMIAVNRFMSTVSGQKAADRSSLCYFEMLHLSRIFRLMLRSNEIAKWEKRGVIKKIHELLPIVLQNKEASVLAKARFTLLAIAPNLYNLIFKLYERKIKHV